MVDRSTPASRPVIHLHLRADGPLFGRGVQRLDWVELSASDKPSSLLSVSRPHSQQPDATTQVCADDFVLTVNDPWDQTEQLECSIRFPAEATRPGAPIVDQPAELLVLTTVMGRVWLHVPVSSGRGKLRER